jgi:hypothetical protein
MCLYLGSLKKTEKLHFQCVITVESNSAYYIVLKLFYGHVYSNYSSYMWDNFVMNSDQSVGVPRCNVAVTYCGRPVNTADC